MSRNVRNEIKKGKKIYFLDNGIRNAVIGNYTPLSGRTDTGALWENYLVSERLKLLSNVGIQAGRYFRRTTQQQEIDYIEEQQQELYAYEFKWNIRKKAVRFPKTFLRNYQEVSTRMITLANYQEFLSIERCIARIREEYLGFEAELESNYTRQDSVILNLERLCQAAMDLAAHLVKVKKLGVPQDSRELFQLLEKGGLISENLSKNLQSMVGFRNLAVHDYQKLNLDIVRSIIENHLADFRKFSKTAIKSVK